MNDNALVDLHVCILDRGGWSVDFRHFFCHINCG